MELLILSVKREKNVVVFKLGNVEKLPSKYWVVNYFKLSNTAKRKTIKELKVNHFMDGDMIVGWYSQFVNWPRWFKKLFKGKFKYFILIGLTLQFNNHGDVLIGKHTLSKLVHDEIEASILHGTEFTEEAQGYDVQRKIK